MVPSVLLNRIFCAHQSRFLQYKSGGEFVDGTEPIQQTIRQKVLNLELDPTQPINEKKLVKETGGTAEQVQAALENLATDEIVVHQRDRWYVAPAATASIMREIFEVRTTLEGMCARLAAERISEEDIEKMEELLHDYDRVFREGDNQALLAVDQKFHKLLYDASGNRFLANALDEMYTLIYRLSYFALDRMASVRSNVEEHHEIVQALKAGDGRAAERVIQHHIAHFQRMVDEIL
jgi:DNA-binding GntR family transcriptional regulator